MGELLMRLFLFLPGYPLAWFHIKVIDRGAAPSGMLYSIGLGVLSLWYGIAVWVLFFLGLAGYGIYRLISG